MTKNQKILFRVMCVCIVFSSLLLQSVSAKSAANFKFQGDWKEVARSASSTIPVSAFVSDGVLSIHSSTQYSDITISISKNGEVLYEETVPASETDFITIDLSDFEPGTYSVELKNRWGGCLWGEFCLG